ncbi:hypothetical protein GCM10018954_017300 [Kutzneria kofuensis]
MERRVHDAAPDDGRGLDVAEAEQGTGAEDVSLGGGGLADGQVPPLPGRLVQDLAQRIPVGQRAGHHHRLDAAGVVGGWLPPGLPNTPFGLGPLGDMSGRSMPCRAAKADVVARASGWHTGIAGGQGAVGPSGEAAGGSQAPLAEALVDQRRPGVGAQQLQLRDRVHPVTVPGATWPIQHFSRHSGRTVALEVTRCEPDLPAGGY